MGILFRLLLLTFFCWSGTGLMAAPRVPEALEPWRDWVLAERPQHLCSSFHDNHDTRVCAWPGQLQLELDANGGRFSQRWQLDAAADVGLPGDATAWPFNVVVNGEPVPVVAKDGRPSIRIEKAGDYSISGRLRWSFMPATLGLPQGSALLGLSIDGKEVPFPRFAGDSLQLAEQGGQIQKIDADTGVKDTLELQVYRLLNDEVPFVVETRLHLAVTGAGRELDLGKPLLPGSIPLSLEAPFPVRLEADGRLRAQVRPGRWELRLKARMQGEVKKVSRGESEKPWPEQEVWSLRRQANIRTLEFSGLVAMDVSSIANYPAEWRNLPSFLAPAGAVLELITKGRGEVVIPPLLQVKRDLWLDFDGQGFTSQDRITGQARGGQRIEADGQNHLGRLEINGTPRYITRNPNTGQAGVEVRENQLNLLAEGRMEEPLRSFPALGWDFEAQSLGIKLHLPPGYRLLHAAGVDEVRGSWVAGWNLWDFFLVLLVGISFWNLFGWFYGALALVALGLGYQEPAAPGVLWLLVLLGIGLLRHLPEGRLAVWVGRFKYLMLFFLILQLLPFAIDQVRLAVYPQLEKTAGFAQRLQVAMPVAEMRMDLPQPAPVPDAEPALAMSMEAGMVPAPKAGISARASLSAGSRKMAAKHEPLPLDSYDPGVRIQSGPGLPQWNWHSYDLNYSGGVTSEQELRLQLVCPTALRLLRLLVVGLFALLLVRLVIRNGKSFKPMASLGSTQASAWLLGPLVLLALNLMPLSQLQAGEAGAMPPQYLLEQLAERLQKPDDCFPQCAELASLRLDLSGNAVRLSLEVHVRKDATAVPLVGKSGEWLPERVEAEGSSEPLALQRHEDGSLRVRLDKGVHHLVVVGSLDARAMRQAIFVPMLARYVEVNNPERHWWVSGLEQQQLPGHYLSFNQQPKAEEQKASLPALEPSSLPPQLVVERHLTLDRELLVQSRLVRLSPRGSALDLRVPLLPGEHLLDKAEVKDGRIHIQLSPGQTKFSWSSRMDQTASLELKAPEPSGDQDWTERWSLGYSSLWLMTQQGPPPTQTSGNGRFWTNQWQPYPGEVLKLGFNRPEGVEGRVTTVTRLDAKVTPGERLTQVQLGLDVRSTQADRLHLKLPAETKLLELLVDGQKRGAEIQDGQLRLETEPGKHRFDIRLTTPEGLETHSSTPRFALDMPYVNENLSIHLPLDRWLLFVHGPSLGPAMLFWGVLLVMLLVAFGLQRLQIPQMKRLDWYLLAIGFATVSLFGLLLLLAWFLALRWRKGQDMGTLSRGKAHFVQVLLVLFTLVVAVQVFDVVQTGMLGFPDMQVVGNGSSAQALNWYRDRSAGELGEAWVLSLPIWSYRLAMLLWSLWLAMAVMRWARFAWGAWSHGGYWNLGIAPPAPEPRAKTSRRPGRLPESDEARENEEKP